MNRVLSYTKQFIKPIIIGPAFKIVETIFELLTPFIMAKLIDEGIPYHDNTIIIRYGSILILFAVLGYACTFVCQYIAAKTQEQYGKVLRHDLFAHVQTLNLEQAKLIGANSLITRLSVDVYQIQAAVAIFIRISPRAPFLLIGSTLMSAFISPQLSLVFLVIVPLVITLFALVMRKTVPLYRRIQQKLDHLSLRTNEGLSGARVIRAFSRQSAQTTAFKRETDRLKQLSLTAGKFEALLSPSTQLIINGAIVAIIYFGQFQVDSGTLSQGQIIAIINYITQISLALIILVNFVVTFARAYTSAGRIEDVFNLTPEQRNSKLTTTSTPVADASIALQLNHVSFTYPHAAVPMLQDISFTLNKGESLGIIGGTGSGKTTLIYLLGRLYNRSTGTIHLNDIDVAQYETEDLHKTLQIVFQQATLFRGTIADNLRLGNQNATDDDLWRALRIAQAAEFVAAKPDGLQTKIDQGGKNLSGGQRQRLSIARSLVIEPEVIIFDDTSSALDYVTDRQLQIAISRLSMTKIIVSQRINAIKDCDHIILLEQGKIRAFSTHEGLIETDALYRQIALSQNILEVTR
jgi:ATP-binding cassette subfamily B protein